MENMLGKYIFPHDPVLCAGFNCGFGSPGRFFVANELKVMMAHLVLNYDVKLENEGIRPPNMDFGFACVPNQKAEVLFRKRQS